MSTLKRWPLFLWLRFLCWLLHRLENIPFFFFSFLWPFIWNLHYEQLLKYGKFRYGTFEYAEIDRMRMICKDIQSIQRKIFVTEFIKRNKSSLMFRIFGCMRGNMNLHEHPQSNYKEPKSLFRLQFILLLNYLLFLFVRH